MYEVLFGFIFLSSVVRLHSCTYSLLPLDVCSCKTALSWPVLLHISTIATCCYLLLLISFIAYVVCHYLCHLLTCIFICRLSLFVPSTGVNFHMYFVTICAIYWCEFSYVVYHYLCHLLACIFICCPLSIHIFLYCYLLLPVAFCCHLFTTGPISDVPPLSAQSWHRTRTLWKR